MLVIRDLRGHFQQLTESPFLEWVEQSAFAKRFAKPKQMAAFRGAIDYLAGQLKTTPRQLLDDILGDAIVFAYQSEGDDTKESGVILVHARNMELLSNLVERINQLQRESGELLDIIEAKHGNAVYFIRVKPDQVREYYYIHGPLFAFSGQQSAIHAVIDRGTATDSTIYENLKQLGIEESFSVLWFNPRQFDQQFAQAIDQSKEQNDRNAQLQFQKIWQATSGLALTLDFGLGIDAQLVAQVNESELPAEWRALLFPAERGHSLWATVPEDAILAIGGRINLPDLLAALRSISSDADRKQLDETIRRDFGAIVGKSKLDPLLAGIGPSWLLWVAPPVGTNWVPTAQASVELQGSDTEMVERSLKQSIDFGLQLLRVQHNRDHDIQIDIDSTRINDVLVQYLDTSLFPNGFRPGYAFIAHHLVISSNSETVAAFEPSATNLTTDCVIRFSPEYLRQYLVKHDKLLSNMIAKAEGREAATVQQELEDISIVLELFRTVEVSYKAKENRIVLSVHVECIKPLKK